MTSEGGLDLGASAYGFRDLRADAIAGLTVAVIGVPQAMAYAIIADVPPVYGLYASIATCFVAAVLGSSSHLVTGPTNASAMVLLGLTAHWRERYAIAPFQIVVLLTFMVGVIQLAFGLFRMGGIVRYVSNSVVVGFASGAGVLIAANQLKNILGVEVAGSQTGRFHEVLAATMEKVPHLNPYALGIGVTVALATAILPRLDRRLPGALIGMAVTGAVTYAFGWYSPDFSDKVDVVRDIQPIAGSLAAMFHVPDLLLAPNYELTRELGSGAFALTLLCFSEVASSSRSIAASSGQRLDFNREFVGQGTANLVGSFCSSMVGSGSFTRTTVCYRSGARSRLGAAFSAAWTALTVVALAPVANYIPKAALAGMLVVVAYSMVDKNRLRLVWRSGSNSRFVLVGTLIATLTLPLEYAIFVGVAMSIALLLRDTSRTDLTQLVPHPEGGFEEVPFNRAAPSPVVTVNLEGDFYFAAVDDLEYELLRCLTPETRVVVLRMKRLRAVGSTAMAILEHFLAILGEKGIKLVVCGIEDHLNDVLVSSGLRARIGESNVFYADNKLLRSLELAHARAWSIVDAERSGRAEMEATRLGEGAMPRAAELVSAQAIRFGDRHPLREAFWLMSEMQKAQKLAEALPLFLQDREGKLSGELTTWHLLDALVTGIGADEDVTSATGLEAALRRRFEVRIATIARRELLRLTRQTTFGELLRVAVELDMDVLPICDKDGRIRGLIDQPALLIALVQRRRAAAGLSQEVKS